MKLFRLALVALLLSRRQRARFRLSSRCLPPPYQSAWEVLWQSQDDNGLVHTTGFDIPTFRIIHDAICHDLYSFGNGQGGRPSRLDTIATTALTLYYLNRDVCS